MDSANYGERKVGGGVYGGGFKKRTQPNLRKEPPFLLAIFRVNLVSRAVPQLNERPEQAINVPSNDYPAFQLDMIK